MSFSSAEIPSFSFALLSRNETDGDADGEAQSETLAQQSSPSALDPSFVARQPKAKPAASLLTPKRLIYTVQKPSAIACLHCSGAVWLCLTKARWLP